MKVMLTSFDIGQENVADSRGVSVFYKMPPVSFRFRNEMFMPDYELLILCDKVVMDEASFERLIHYSAHAYSGVAETFRALRADGRIQLVDFPAVLSANSDLLDKMLEHDMSILDQWVSPLRESLGTWRHFAELSMNVWNEGFDQVPTRGLHAGSYRRALLQEVGHIMHSSQAAEAYRTSHIVELALRSATKRRSKKYRDVLRNVIRAYLAYVNANLILANELDIPFHDWLDFTPFYSAKFLSVGKHEDRTQQERRQVERLFTVAFPNLAIRDTASLLKVINDKRIGELRQLISDAVDGKVQFDDGFAKSVLEEVLRNERRVTRFRNVLGYVTLPIGFVPGIGTPVQKIVEEAVGLPIARKMREKHRWFYMLSELADAQERGQEC